MAGLCDGMFHHCRALAAVYREPRSEQPGGRDQFSGARVEDDCIDRGRTESETDEGGHRYTQH